MLADEVDECVADGLRAALGIKAAAREVRICRRSIVDAGELGRWQAVVTPQSRDDSLQLGIAELGIHNLSPSAAGVSVGHGKVDWKAVVVDLAVAGRESSDFVV